MVSDLNPGIEDGILIDLLDMPHLLGIPYKGDFYFTGNSPETGLEIFKINQATEKPELACNLSGNADSPYPCGLFEFNNLIFFGAFDYSENRYELHIWDGESPPTEAGNFTKLYSETMETMMPVHVTRDGLTLITIPYNIDFVQDRCYFETVE